jgi:hypothetical protein
VTDHTGAVSRAWRGAWADRAFRIQTIVTVPLLVLILSLLARFLEGNEARQGVVLADPLLALFRPHDVTWITFALIYIGLIAAIAYLLRHPATLLLAMQSYALMVLFRIVAMTLIPLEPPPTMIPLNDPLVEIVGTGRLLTKDLFFSGHTSTLFLLFLVTPSGKLKTAFLVCTLLVACCVLLQHVHYGIDVFVAPFVAYASVRIVRTLRSRAETARAMHS